jgi:alcohol dehydrogenase class IV
MGFGNGGVHIPHANAYPIAGMVKDYRPAGYPQDEPMVPHGQSVSLTAPEAFRFSFASAPERHLRAAALLAPGEAVRPGRAAAASVSLTSCAIPASRTASVGSDTGRATCLSSCRGP